MFFRRCRNDIPYKAFSLEAQQDPFENPAINYY